jgi:hypothetical protein
MAPEDPRPCLVTESSLAGFFRASVDRAIHNQNVQAAEGTVAYLTGLLTRFARSDQLFDYAGQGPALTPLVEIYRHAVEARSERERRLVLQRLGDIALFVGGLFAGWVGRRLVGLDYYVSMGGAAYGYLSEQAPERSGERPPPGVFGELSRGFGRFVEVVAEVGDQAPARTGCHVIETYDAWLRRASPHLERRLRALGVAPTPRVPVH